MNRPLTQKFSLGQIVVDPTSNAIFLKSVEKRLEPKLIALLCLLAAQGRQVISRQEITDTIWPGVVVGEESVARTVFALRNALGDDAKQPQFIETIPKKGYRLLVDAQLIDELPAGLVETPDTIRKVNRRWVVSAVIVVSIFALMGIWFWSDKEVSGLEIEAIVPVNKMDGVERDIKLSADGKQLLFIHDAGVSFDIYSRDLQAGKDTMWTHQNLPMWSPIWIDQNSIAYVCKDKNEFQIVRQYQGQPRQTLYQSSKPVLQLSQAEGDSDNLFWLEFQNNDLTELKSLNLRSGEQLNWRDSVAEWPKKINQLQNAKLPNRLLMVTEDNGKPIIVSLDLHLKKITQLSDHFNKINKVSAATDGSLLVAGNRGVSQGLWFFDAKTKPKLILRSSSSEEIVDVQIDAKRKTIFYSNLQENTDVRLVSLRDESKNDLIELNSTGVETKGVSVEGGKFVCFISNRTGFYEIWRYEVESKSVKQISTLNALSITWFSISNNKKLLSIAYQTDELYLAILDAESGQIKVKTSTPSHRFPLAWSLDDKTIFASEHEVHVNLFTYDTRTLTAQLFAPQAGLYVKDLDGKRIIFFDYARHGLVEKDLATGQEKILRDNLLDINTMIPGMLKLNRQNTLLFAACSVEWRNQICSYSLVSSQEPPTALKDISYNLFATDIAEDGETVLATEHKPSFGDIMKMQLRH